MTMTLLRFSIHRFDLDCHHIADCLRNLGECVTSWLDRVCGCCASGRNGLVWLPSNHYCPADACQLVDQCHDCLVVASSLDQAANPATWSVVTLFGVTGNGSGAMH